jgi:hypothetical protein
MDMPEKIRRDLVILKVAAEREDKIISGAESLFQKISELSYLIIFIQF